MIAFRECQREEKKGVVTFSTCFVYVSKLIRRRNCDYDGTISCGNKHVVLEKLEHGGKSKKTVCFMSNKTEITVYEVQE